MQHFAHRGSPLASLVCILLPLPCAFIQGIPRLYPRLASRAGKPHLSYGKSERLAAYSRPLGGLRARNVTWHSLQPVEVARLHMPVRLHLASLLHRASLVHSPNSGQCAHGCIQTSTWCVCCTDNRRMPSGLGGLPAGPLVPPARQLARKRKDLGRLACYSRELPGRTYRTWPADPLAEDSRQPAAAECAAGGEPR